MPNLALGVLTSARSVWLRPLRFGKQLIRAALCAQAYLAAFNLGEALSGGGAAR
jgi:hypothetical protein